MNYGYTNKRTQTHRLSIFMELSHCGEYFYSYLTESSICHSFIITQINLMNGCFCAVVIIAIVIVDMAENVIIKIARGTKIHQILLLCTLN